MFTVPSSVMKSSAWPASVWISSEPSVVPVACGTKLTERVQVAPVTSVAQVPAEAVKPKDGIRFPIWTVAVPVLVSVTDCAVLAVPTAVPAKYSEPAELVNAAMGALLLGVVTKTGVAVPFRSTNWGAL